MCAACAAAANAPEVVVAAQVSSCLCTGAPDWCVFDRVDIRVNTGLAGGLGSAGRVLLRGWERLRGYHAHERDSRGW